MGMMGIVQKPKNFKNAKRRSQDWRDRNDTKTAVLSLVHKDTGEVRSRVVNDVKRDTLRKAIRDQVDLPAVDLHTDNAAQYVHIGWEARSHGSVNHGMSEYVRDGISTNQAEGYFAQLKRSLDGTHHRISEVHLDRYLAEFDFRYSTRKLSDTQRMARLMGQTAGRRLSYRPLIGG